MINRKGRLYKANYDRLFDNCHPELVSGSLFVIKCATNEIPKQVRNDRIRFSEFSVSLSNFEVQENFYVLAAYSAPALHTVPDSSVLQRYLKIIHN